MKTLLNSLFIFLILSTPVLGKKYVLISSYNLYNLCGELQVEGALRRLREEGETARLYYVNFRKEIKNDIDRERIIRRILTINGNNCTYVVFDDLAYSYAKQILPNLYVSGINGNVYVDDNYKAIILERYDFSQVQNFFKEVGFHVKKYLVLYDVNSPTSSFLVNNLTATLNNYDLIPVKTVNDVEKVEKHLNSSGMIIISLVTSLRTQDKVLSNIEVAKRIRSIFKHNILVGYNAILLSLGYDLVVTVSFEEMGYNIMDIAIKGYTRRKPFIARSYLLLNEILNEKLPHIKTQRSDSYAGSFER